jgi:hypothetical protein
VVTKINWIVVSLCLQATERDETQRTGKHWMVVTEINSDECLFACVCGCDRKLGDLQTEIVQC